jgi:hypothetical protein
LRRFWRERRASSTVETVILTALLIGFFGGFSAYVLGAHARSVVIAAADTAARTAAIECGLGEGAWQADAVAAGERALEDGGLHPAPVAPGQPGYWTVVVSAAGGCPGGSAVTAAVSYDQADLFPFVGPLLGAGPASGPVFAVQSSAVFPVD